MAGIPAQPDVQRADHHASEAERLLKSRLGLLSSHVKAQVHATLAVYYAAKAERSEAQCRAGQPACGVAHDRNSSSGAAHRTGGRGFLAV